MLLVLSFWVTYQSSRLTFYVSSLSYLNFCIVIFNGLNFLSLFYLDFFLEVPVYFDIVVYIVNFRVFFFSFLNSDFS